MRRSGIILYSFFSCILSAQAADTSGIEKGDEFFKQGQYLQAADQYYTSYITNRTGKRAAEALVKTGRALDLAKKGVYEVADAKCYLNKRPGEARPECFEASISDLNRRFGEGAFSYHGDQVQFSYNATHFKKVLAEFPGSPYEDEASLMLLRGPTLLGDEPDPICQKVEDWLNKFPESRLRPQALLLLGRLHADAVVVLKRGGFVLVNGKIDPAAVAIQRSKHQDKGLAAFLQVIDKFGNSPEAHHARREYHLLKEGKDDGIFYGISF